MPERYLEHDGWVEEANDEAALEADLLYDAWGVIANVSEGDWTKQPQEWQDAARRWRDRWHEHLEGGDE